MRKLSGRFSIILILALMLTSVPSFVMADSAGDNVSQVIYYLRQGNVSGAQSYNKQLPATAANESCVVNMPEAMKTAYRNKVKSCENVKQYGNYVFYNYWLTDIDNDGVAELLLNLAPDSASAMTHVYTYKSGRLVKLGSFSGNETVHAYPSHNGIITEGGKMGYNWLSLITVQDGELVTEQLISYGYGNLSWDQYFHMRNQLKSHSKWNGDRYVPLYEDLGGVSVPATSISKVTAAKKAFTVKWKKKSGVSGYQIQYGTKSSFKGAKTVTVKKATAKSKKIKKLKSKKKYYVRVRTYKTVNGIKHYSSWSKKKSIKTR